MADAVLPQAIFPPAIAMVSADQDGGTEKTRNQSRELLVDPGQTSLLTPGTFCCTAGITAKWTAG